MTIEVIEALDPTGREMVRRVPEHGSGEFELGAQVIVRESQTAVFFRDGKSYDSLGPGRHTLSTLNIPLLTEPVTDRIFGESPFKAEVYFVNEKVFLGQKWGTSDPIVYRDAELSEVRLRARGTMAVRVTDPPLFVNKVVGTQGVYTTKDIVGFLKTIASGALAQVFGRDLKTLYDLPIRYGELETATKAMVFETFNSYGVELVEFVIEAVTPPDEVQQRIDERTGMAAVGDLAQYMRYKSAVAIGDAAEGGGTAGQIVDGGIGLGLGFMLPGMMQQAFGGSGEQGAGSTPAASTIMCGSCSNPVPGGSKFCPECGVSLIANLCPHCNSQLGENSKFCASCGKPVDAN